MEAVDQTDIFEAERPRLVGIAAPGARRPRRGRGRRAAGVAAAARDRPGDEIDNLPAWLTTVTTRLCLDRLRSRTPVPVEDVEPGEHRHPTRPTTSRWPTPSVSRCRSCSTGSHPRERVAFVLHDSFGFEFPRSPRVLDTTPAAARKLASRARAKVAQPAPEDHLADWEVVDAFMAAAREGDFDRLLRLLAPDAVVTADDAAVLVGTPRQIEGRERGGDVLQRQRAGRARGLRR